MTVYVEEFLFRGRPAGAEEPPAWHVVLGDVTTDAFGRQTIATSGPMTPAQAEAAGYPLPTVLGEINAVALAQVAALQAQVAALEAQVAAMPQPAAEPEPDPAPAE